VRETVNGGGKFAWQNGYSDFTVSSTARASVRTYIANQEEHHRVKSFREELVETLERAGVSYEPKYSALTGHELKAPP
jgi:putative transposase